MKLIFSQKKPYSAVTVQIDRLTSEQYEEHDIVGIIDLVEVIRIQESGPTEAARALRKKLKYGNVHRQLRALTILDGLLQNAGSRFQRTFADEPLLERLRVMVRDDMVDVEVKKKCNELFRGWAAAYKNKQGLSGIATLYKQLPRTKRPQPSQSKVVRETEQEAQQDDPPSLVTHARNRSASNAQVGSSSSSQNPAALGSTSTTSSSIFRKDKKSKGKPFSLEKEKPQLMETIASASVASTNLMNGLQLINREQQRVSENSECVKRFETCKQLRRQILRYIQLIESEQWLGSLLSANDELVKALMAYEIVDKSIDDDSDSETEAQIAMLTASTAQPAHESLAGLNLNDNAAPPKPPRPTSIPMPPQPAAGKQVADEDSEPEVEDDDPFGDQNAVKTPYTEKSQMTWRDV